MPGFSNSVVYFEKGIDPRGTPPVANQMDTNGKLLIGSVASPYVVCNVPTGSSGVAITTGPGTLDFSYTGSRTEQIIYAQTGALVTCTTVIPVDPQITEGDEVLTATITPKHATNILVIEFSTVYGSPGCVSTFALFQDATANALAATYSGTTVSPPNPNANIILRHVMVAGTTSATTFKVHAGPELPLSTYVNGSVDTYARECGGVAATTLTITEFNAGGAGTSLASLTSLTGNSGGGVHPDGALNINVIGGTGINIVGTPGTNTLTVNATATGMTWNDATSANVTFIVNEGYVTNRGGGVAYVLPATATFGDKIEVVGKAGLAAISQNANQQIVIGNLGTTIGVGGSLTATDAGDCLVLRCITGGASTVWRVESSMGNWTIV
jgi:hypothetical protein